MYCGISWAPSFRIWGDLEKAATIIPGLKTNVQVLDLADVINNDKEMLKFIEGCYFSHEKIDSPDANLQRLADILNKKYQLENFLNVGKKILFFTFDVEDEESVINFVTQYLKSEWQFDDQRISRNKVSNKTQNHSFTLNLIKDFLRRKFCHDNRLDPYYKGPILGRKRILHTPATEQGCIALSNHLKGFIKNAERVSSEPNHPNQIFDLNLISGIEQFRSLSFPIEKYAIMNSSWQAALGKRKNGDIDVLVAQDFLDEALSLAKPPVSIMKYVHWYCAQATGLSSASEVIKKHSVIIDGIRIISFDTYIKMMEVRKNSNTRFSEPAKVDLDAISSYISLNGVPVNK